MTMAQSTKWAVIDRPAIEETSVYRAPLHGGYLRKLPVGQIQPRGWLREILTRQRDGLCGQLGSVSALAERPRRPRMGRSALLVAWLFLIGLYP